MPSVPHLGSVTICEINRDLIIADNLSDDRAKDTYGKVLGMVFSPVPFQSDELASSSPDRQESEQGARREGEGEGKGLVSALHGIINHSIKQIFHPDHVSSVPL